jgi:hypothetical protein
MPIALLKSETFAVSLACDVDAYPDEKVRPAFRFRYLDEVQRTALVEALDAAETAKRRDEVRAALIPALERHFVRTENMPAEYSGWDNCTMDEWYELTNLVLRKQDLAEVDLKKSRSMRSMSAASSVPGAHGPGSDSPSPISVPSPASAAAGESAQPAEAPAG